VWVFWGLIWDRSKMELKRKWNARWKWKRLGIWRTDLEPERRVEAMTNLGDLRLAIWGREKDDVCVGKGFALIRAIAVCVCVYCCCWIRFNKNLFVVVYLERERERERGVRVYVCVCLLWCEAATMGIFSASH
jgi:hypothetical protein